MAAPDSHRSDQNTRFLVPRLRLGTHCSGGSASTSWRHSVRCACRQSQPSLASIGHDVGAGRWSLAMTTRRSLEGSAVPGRAWDRGGKRMYLYWHGRPCPRLPANRSSTPPILVRITALPGACGGRFCAGSIGSAGGISSIGRRRAADLVAIGTGRGGLAVGNRVVRPSVPLGDRPGGCAGRLCRLPRPPLAARHFSRPPGLRLSLAPRRSCRQSPTRGTGADALRSSA